MSYLYRNSFSTIYEANVGSIVKINDSKSKYDNQQMYLQSGTFNGYCYKDYNNFKNYPNEVCYIAESSFDDLLFVDYVNENKEKLINEGGISTANSIKEEIRKTLEYEEYYYIYQKDGIVHTIEAKDFDDELINLFADIVFDIVDWQCTSSFISEKDWCDEINNYYIKKLNREEIEL